MKRFAIRFNAPVVLSFAILSLLVLVLDSATGGASTARLFCVYRAPLTDPLTYVRFFTHVLGHSGYSHYMGNMLLLLLVGPGLEEKYGSRNLLLTIVITAFATGLVQFLLFPHSALLGASGVVFMMIVLSSFTEMKKGGIPLTMLLVVALYLGSEIADGLTRTDNVSHLTHIVGGVSGIVFGYTRPHLGHDLMSAVGTPVIAVESGKVECLGWNRYGGWRIGIRSLDNKRYWYYAHLRQNRPYAENLKEGDTVTAGDVIGYVGRTGYSDTENINGITESHLHIGLELVFDESQKESDNEIWVDMYALISTLEQHKSSTVRNSETKEFKREFSFKEIS